jgi:uncharacterized repeat protein (TIGR01451 family)
MEEDFLQWISIIPGVGPQRAKRLKEAGFTTSESIRAATLEEIAKIEGIGRELAKRLKDYAEEIAQLKEEETFLFLCPECGAFISKAAKRCEVCGATFEEGAPEARELKAEPEIVEEGEEIPELYICPACGRFIGRDVRKCPHCSASFDEEPERDVDLEKLMLELEKQLEDLEEDIKSPLEELEEYLKEEPLEVEPEEEKAIAKDFLKRWKRVSEEEEAEGTRRLEEELRHYDSLLEADPSLERAWEKRAILLVELGRFEEAIECYDKLTELNPEREEDYKLEVLNLVKEREGFDVTPVEVEEPLVLDEREEIERAIAHYDELLRIDPALKQAWQTRGELLEKLGRHEEAVASYDRAIECSRQERLQEIMDLAGLRKKGLLEGRTSSKALIQRMGRTNGLVNGMVNGRVNGIVNGRVNGLVNGMVNGRGRVNGMTNGLVNGRGRVNGMVNGLVNGLVNGKGRVNGMVNGLVNGLVNGMGRVNGLVNGLINGNGMVNGRAAKHMPRLSSSDIRWPRALGTVAAVLSILIVVPLLLGLVAPPPTEPPIEIDGYFGDWSGVRSFADAQLDQTSNADVNFISYKAEDHLQRLYVYARVEGVMLNGSSIQGIDSVFVFVDMDDNPSTGYPVAGLGSDRLIEVTGWNNTIYQSIIFEFQEGHNRDDWNSFRRIGSVNSAIGVREIELNFGINGARNPKLFVACSDNSGNIDSAETIISPNRDVLSVVQTTIASEVVPTSQPAHFLKLDLDTRNGGAHVSQINISKSGDIPDQSVAVDLGVDTDGDDIPDQMISSARFNQGVAYLELDLDVVGGTTLITTAVFTDPDPFSTIGISVSGIVTNATVSLKEGFVTRVYADAMPEVTIDGAFGDWTAAQKESDSDGDVAMKVGPTAWINENVDLRSYAVDISVNASFYASVDGRMMGGVDLPTFRKRPIVSLKVVDSDRDSVPDDYDYFRFDFDNDAIPDSQSGSDYDGDGVLDYPLGSDYWLNTTIPSDFPAEYANREISIYIGPLSIPEVMGVDVLSVFLDADNDTATGLPLIAGSQIYGVDYLLAISGRNGMPRIRGLYEYVPGNIPWALVVSISELAFDTKSIEFSIPMTSIQLDSDFSAIFHISDWQGDFDSSDQAAGRSRGGGIGTRSPAGDNVIVNEVYSVTASGEWFELANPTVSSIDLDNWELQIKFKGKWLTIYTFGAVTIGAWLSGSEYLDVDLPPNSIKDKPVDIRLMDDTGTEVDYTKLPKLKPGESWARFKSGTDGKPEDTDSGQADFYVSIESTKGRYNDRHRPRITVSKTSNVASAAPGDQITYMIYYNNTGGGISKDIWINDTLPAEVTFVSSSVSYSWMSGSTYHWNLTNAAPGSSNSFTITVQVNDGFVDGSRFNNFVELNYTDVFRQPMEWSSANKTLFIERPMITVVKIADVTDAGPGDSIVYTIYYNNTGNGTAAHVWVNDTLPIYTTFQSSSVSFESRFGLTYVFHFYDVAPGSNSFTITVTVNASAPDGIYITNWAFLNYTTENGYSLLGNGDSAVVRIPEYDFYLIPVIGVVVIFIFKRRMKKREEEDSEKE